MGCRWPCCPKSSSSGPPTAGCPAGFCDLPLNLHVTLVAVALGGTTNCIGSPMDGVTIPVAHVPDLSTGGAGGGTQVPAGCIMSGQGIGVPGWVGSANVPAPCQDAGGHVLQIYCILWCATAGLENCDASGVSLLHACVQINFIGAITQTCTIDNGTANNVEVCAQTGTCSPVNLSFITTPHSGTSTLRVSCNAACCNSTNARFYLVVTL